MDAVGSAIRVDSRGREVMRILPRVNEAVNEEWISDKTRYVVDGLRTQRLDRPYIRENGKLAPGELERGLRADRREGEGGEAGEDRRHRRRSRGGRGDVRAEEPDRRARQRQSRLPPGRRQAASEVRPRLLSLQRAASPASRRRTSLLIIGANPRREAPVLNARIRKRWLRGDFKVGVIGEQADLTYDYDYLGAGPETLADLVKHALPPARRSRWSWSGRALSPGADGEAVLSLAAKAAQLLGAVDGRLERLRRAAHRRRPRRRRSISASCRGEGGCSTSPACSQPGALDVLFLLGADEIEVAAGAFVVYQGTHGDRGAHRADVILPGAAYTEKSGTYVNTEGRVQMADRAVFPPGDAREDWAILRALSAVLGETLPFDSLAGAAQALYAAHPHFAALDRLAGERCRRARPACRPRRQDRQGRLRLARRAIST